MPALHLFIEEGAKRAYKSLSSVEDIFWPDVLHGEQVDLSVTRVKKATKEFHGRVLEPLPNLSNFATRAGIGSNYPTPLAGVETFTWDGLDHAPEETDVAQYNASAAQLETVFNALVSITAEGGVVVQEEANRLFLMRWNEPGARGVLTADATRLAPLSAIDIGVLIEGEDPDGDFPGIHHVITFRFEQNVPAFVELEDDLEATVALVTVLQGGGGGDNHRVRITISPEPMDGKTSIKVGGEESALIDVFTEDAADIIAALEAMVAVGEGNVQVEVESIFSWLVSFIEGKADTDMGVIEATSDAIRSIPGKRGSLSLATAGIDLLLGSESTIAAIIEVERKEIYLSPPLVVDPPINIYRKDITLRNRIITPSSFTPPNKPEFYTKAEIDALLLAAPAFMPDIENRNGGAVNALDGSAVDLLPIGKLVIINTDDAGPNVYVVKSGNIGGDSLPAIVVSDANPTTRYYENFSF